MATTSLKSIPCATPEMAAASLNGSIAEYGKAHKVNVRGIDIQEVEGPDGQPTFIAMALIEIEDLEEEEDEEEKKSEFREAEDIIEKENDLFELTHAIRPSVAERSFPDVGGEGPPEQNDMIAQDDGNASATSGSDGVQDIYAEDEANRSDDIIGIDQSRTELSENLQSDFSQAMSEEPPPPETLPDSALIYNLGTAPVMTPQELIEAEETERRRHQEALALLTAGQIPPPEGPEPSPQE